MRYLFLFFCTIGATLATAQDTWEDPKTGEIENSQIIIEKDRQIELPRASRSFKEVPKVKRDSVQVPVSFSIREFQPSLNPIKPRIRVLTIKEEKLEKLYANQVKGGVGNLGATYFEAFLANKRSKNRSYGLQLLHESFAKGAVDEKNSASGYQLVQPFGKFISEKVTVEASAFYERRNNYLFGYDSTLTEVDRDSLQRTFHTVGAAVELKDRNRKDTYNYGLAIDAYQLFTNNESGEEAIAYKLNNELELSDQFKIYLNSNGFLSKYHFQDDAFSRNRSLFRIQPGIIYEVGKLHLKGGLNFVYENDTLDNMNQLHAYPDLLIKYQILPNISAKAGIRGDVRDIKLRDLLRENPYLSDSVVLNHTLMPFEFYGAIYGSLAGVLGFDVGVSLASVKNNYGYWPVYKNTTTFNPVYFAGDNTEINIYTGVSAQINKNWRANLRGDYFYFNLSEGLIMPYRPALQLQFNSSYSIAEKFTIGLNAHLQSSMDPGVPLGGSPYLEGTAAEEIPAIYDLSLKLNYKISERSAVFLDANNLIAKEYQYYLNYPNRGFQVLGGFIYSF